MYAEHSLRTQGKLRIQSWTDMADISDVRRPGRWISSLETKSVTPTKAKLSMTVSPNDLRLTILSKGFSISLHSTEAPVHKEAPLAIYQYALTQFSKVAFFGSPERKTALSKIRHNIGRHSTLGNDAVDPGVFRRMLPQRIDTVEHGDHTIQGIYSFVREMRPHVQLPP